MTSLAILIPSVPWFFSKGAPAVVASCVIGLALAGMITYARPGGWKSSVQTYGILIGVGAIATVAGRLT